MTREKVEKAVGRIHDFYEELDLIDPFSIGEIYEEAFIRSMMEYDSTESFDYETRKWFIEDEAEWEQAKERSIKEIECIQEFQKKIMKHYDELEKEEIK